MSSNSYNPKHWQKRIPNYLSAVWSRSPSPFARLVNGYIKPDSKILELGAGAGQDGLWFETQGHQVTISDGDTVAFDEITSRSINKTIPIKIDLNEPFPLEDGQFDVVYAQLVLHYFDDDTMRKIFNEIKRVLKPNGIIACMVNSINDPEYDSGREDNSGLIDVNGLIKRYFSVETFSPFLEDYESLLFDNNGRTPKDDEVNTSGMVQFIGKLKTK